MAFFVDLRLCLIVLISNCVTLVVSKEKPRSPETYYAVVNSNASLPCVAGHPGDRLRWNAARPDRSLKARSRTAVDVNDPDLWLHQITGVQLSDAGTFLCTDGSEASTTELVVFEPSSVRNVEAITDIPDEIKVRWRAPSDSVYLVRGYNIYVTEVGQAGKEVKITVNDVSSDAQEEYTLTDFIPGTTYQIQVAPLFVKGVEEVGEVTEGPRSPQVRITPPKFEPVPYNVKAEPWYNSTILVTWLPPRLEGSSAVDGYIVYYTAVGKKDAPTGEVTVTRPDPSNQWSAVLKGLKTKNKYKIQVAPFTGGSRKVVGDKSKEVLVAHDGFVPELSILAIPVSPDTVLITVDTVGGDKVDKLRILYSDDSAIKWTRVDDYNSEEKYAVVTGLQPRTKYFFNAKATVNKKARSVVTHVQTPPSGLSPPTNISVSAKTDRSVLITWNHDAVVPAKGFIVLTDNLQQDGSVRPVKQNVVFKQNEAVVDGLDSGEKYQVKVEPFNLESIGTCGDPVLFQLNGVDETTPSEPERRAPQFVDKPQDELQINTGDDVRLTCAATGSPHPVVQWYVDNLPHGKPADRVSEIMLSGVQKSIRLTCRASNDVRTIDSQTNVIVTPEIEPEAPRFHETLDSVVVVSRGSDVRLWCSATGNPVPVVSWYKDNVLRASAQGRAEFVESRVSGHFDLTCVARNEFGSIDTTTKVYIRDYLRSPSLRSSLPKTVEARQGESVTINCVFDGVPTPNVTWYNGSTKLGEAALGQNSLKIDSVERSAVFTCQGENLIGFASQVVELKVIPKEQPRQSDYVVVLKAVKLSTRDVKVKWAVNEGNLNDIRYFDVKLLTGTGSVLLSQTRGSTVRSETFKRLSPNTKYIVNVQTGTSRSVVDNSSVEFITSHEPIDWTPMIFVDITEVRDSTAMLEFSAKNLEPEQVSRYRVRVIDLAASIGNTILKRDNFRPDTPIVLENLKPNRNYQVIVDALARYGAELLTAIANFTTAGPGQYGTPVSTNSSMPSPQTAATSRPTRRTPPTAAARTVPTRASTDRTTTEQPLVVTTSFEVTTAEEPENHDYVMTTKIPTKTPYSVDIRWTVDRGPLENIKNFLVTIKGERGNTLLEQTLPENQRYITIQSLGPNTKYFVNVKANGAQGSLVESEVSFQTDPADAKPDTSNPVLELEANEVRAHNTRIDWTLVNVEPNLVKSYKLRVLDTGPDGFNLLTQTMLPSSQSLSLQQLQPNKQYHVILEALAADNSVLMTASLTFQTPSENRYGRPVSASSRDRQQTRPVPEQLSRNRASQLGSSRGSDDTSSDAVLEFRIQPLSQSSSQLAWAIQNMPVGLIDGYVLKFKRNGPQGDVVLRQNLTLDETIFKVDGLVRNKQYFVELDAMSKSGSPVVSASTLYQPGTSVAPIRVTLKQSDRSRSQTQSQEGDSQLEDDDESSKPEIDLELNPAGLNQVKVNWTVTKDNRRRPVAFYKIRVFKDGPEGRLLLEDQLTLNVVSYTVNDLMEDIRYYIHLDALDKYGSVIEYVGYTYLVPPPGYAVEPIRTSSVFNKGRAETTVRPREPEESPDGQELVITAAEAQGPNTMLVEWASVQTGAAKRPQETIVRYAEFAGNVRGNFRIETVPPGQQRLVLRNLKPDTTYGIQVASRGTGGYHVRWSKLIMRKTARV